MFKSELVIISGILRYRVFIKYYVFSKILIYIPDSGLSRFSLGSVCVHNGRSNTADAGAAAELSEFRKITNF